MQWGSQSSTHSMKLCPLQPLTPPHPPTFAKVLFLSEVTARAYGPDQWRWCEVRGKASCRGASVAIVSICPTPDLKGSSIPFLILLVHATAHRPHFLDI